MQRKPFLNFLLMFDASCPPRRFYHMTDGRRYQSSFMFVFIKILRSDVRKFFKDLVVKVSLKYFIYQKQAAKAFQLIAS